MILPAQTIRRLELLSPCLPRTRFNGVTHGLGPAGYDLRVAGDVYLYSGCSRLVDAIETFNMPNDVMGIIYTKSTWARLHVEAANTVIEPGWHRRGAGSLLSLGGSYRTTIRRQISGSATGAKRHLRGIQQMNIEIRKRQLHRMHIMQSGEFIHPVDYTIFVIVQNGKRIDAFLKKRNA
jgi:deoxycytidine triphosphate deaminase